MQAFASVICYIPFSDHLLSNDLITFTPCHSICVMDVNVISHFERKFNIDCKWCKMKWNVRNNRMKLWHFQWMLAVLPFCPINFVSSQSVHLHIFVGEYRASQLNSATDVFMQHLAVLVSWFVWPHDYVIQQLYIEVTGINFILGLLVILDLLGVVSQNMVIHC